MKMISSFYNCFISIGFDLLSRKSLKDKGRQEEMSWELQMNSQVFEFNGSYCDLIITPIPL